MKSITSKIIAPFLALLMLFSTLSFTIEQHFCGDTLVDTSYFGAVENCGMEEIPNEDNDSLKLNSCCKNTVHHIEGQDELQKTAYDALDISQQQFVIAFTISYQNLFKYLERQIIPHKTYPPPDIIKDIQVLHEVFII